LARPRVIRRPAVAVARAARAKRAWWRLGWSQQPVVTVSRPRRLPAVADHMPAKWPSGVQMTACEPAQGWSVPSTVAIIRVNGVHRQRTPVAMPAAAWPGVGLGLGLGGFGGVAGVGTAGRGALRGWVTVRT
jgi:hypothetical protein